MSENKGITDYQKEIDKVDQEILNAMVRRMELASEEARCKKEAGLPVSNPIQERQKLEAITKNAPLEYARYSKLLYNTMTELVHDHERKIVLDDTPLVSEIKRAREKTAKVFPSRAIVACQGVQGAYQQQACDKLFEMPQIMYMKNFNGVFAAIEQGLCQYGVLPLENSTAGSVNSIYDLMTKYHFYIVRSVRLKINHCLLVKPGTKRDEIKEIYSHEMAILQCEDYLKNFSDVRVVECSNTAEAAELVSRSGRKDVAALASFECAELYGLECLEESVQDSGNNYTRFICISKNLEIYPGANKTSLILTASHKPGSLYNILSRFYALNINISKLESRPIPTRDFVYRFYFDIEAEAYSEKFIRLMNQTEELSQELRYLGSYSEI